MIDDVVNKMNSYKGSFADKTKAFMRSFKSTVLKNSPKLGSDGPEHPITHYDYTDYCMCKRVEGTVHGISEARKRLSDVMSPPYLEAYFIFSNSLIMKGGYNDSIDYYNVVVLSAAIWILDELTFSGKIDEIYPYLPSLDDDQKAENITHPVIHPMYDDSLINALVYLIRHRNTSKMAENHRLGSLVWENEKTDKDEKSQELRNAFNAIISLINSKAIESAVQNYETKVWDFYRIAFSIMDAVEKRTDKILKEIEDLQQPVKSALDISKPRNVLALQATPAPSFADVVVSRDWEKNQNKIRQLENELDLLDDITLTCISLPNDREKLVKRIKDIIPETLAEELISFHVKDPFESAFALLYLMDQKSLIPWLYYGSISVAYTLGDQLPFDTKLKWNIKPVRISEWDDVLYQHRYKGYRFPDRTDASGETVEREYAVNLSQLVFANTLSLIPRVAPEQANMTEYLAGFGELTEHEKEAYSLLSYALVSGLIRADSASEYQAIQAIKKEFAEDLPVVEPEGTENRDREEDAAQLAAENKRLRERNKELIERLGSVLAGRKEDGKQLYLLQRKSELQEKELSDLREAVFALENSSEREIEIDTSIQFPYVTKKKIVSFGGHPTWLKEMRQKLPGVTFVGPDVLPNIELIRNADAVWLQTNCLSHSDYYRIINIVRQTGILLKYFAYPGTDKCAEQVVKATGK